MASEWRRTTLGSVASLVSGGTPSKANPDFWNGSVPWVSAKDMKTFHLGDSEDHLSLDAAESVKVVPAGSVLMLARGMTLLNDVPICLIGRPMAFNQDVKAVLPKAGMIAEFLPYLLLGNKDRLLSLVDLAGHGTGRLNSTDVKGLDVVVPSPSEQHAIARILGTLDDKIELNRRMSETLEAMARALFKSWFVDFDPVRAKAKGRSIDLSEAAARLFPSHFEDSDAGELPAGWRSGTLVDCSSLNPESWSKDTRPDQLNYVDLANAKWGRLESIASFAREDAPSRAQRVLRPLDTIVGTVRPGNGSYAFICDKGLTGSTGFAVLRPSTRECAEFVYLAATRRENIEALAHLADGGAYPAVRGDVVAGTPVALPPDDVLVAFSGATRPLFERWAANERESRTLALLRDTLLPKLISGELRVKDAERVAGAVL